MDRNELQTQAVDILEQKKRLICMWATGTGKSNVLLKFLQKHPGFRTLILVPEQNNIQNWLDEFDKFQVPTLGVDIICYASLHKMKNTKWDICVYDEMPHADTDKRNLISKSIEADYVLALGAVVTWEERVALEKAYGSFVLSEFGLTDAIDNGIIPIPTINVMHLKLDDTKYTYLHEGAKFTAKGYYNILQKKVKNAVAAYEAHESYITKQRMLLAGNERKKFLGKLKQNAMRDICEKLEAKDKRFLCFCSSIKQAEELGEDKAFTSKTPTSMKLLDKFNNKEINSLYVVGKLIEGQNLKDIECGVIGQLGGTERITVQSIGRVLRAKNPEVYVLVFDDTKDKAFLKTLTNNVSKEYIKHYNY